MSSKPKIITDYDEFKKAVDNRCKKYKASMGTAIEHGGDLRDKIIELNSVVSSVDEVYATAMLWWGLQKERVENVKALAMVALLTEEKHKKIPATLKRYHLDIVEIEYEGMKTTFNEEKVRLVWCKYAVDSFQTTLKTIDRAIMGRQSGLKFDIEEMKRLGYGQ